jgi:hypothetical protein
MGYLYNGVETTGVPLKMINDIIKGVKVEYFVETGTAGGESIIEASKHFPTCYTIELIEGRTPNQIEKMIYGKTIINRPMEKITIFSSINESNVPIWEIIDEDTGIILEADGTIVDHVFNEIKYPENIIFYVGDSTELLPKINIEINNNYAIYWLDAHYSDPEASPEGCVECPIISEIQAISDNQKAIIVIDDARLFLGTPPPPLKPNEWVDIQTLFKEIENNFNNHHITIIDDYVVAVPKELKNNLNRFWLNTYKNRFK